MTRFYFNLHETGEIVRDIEGREFPDLSAAKRAAIKDARSIMGYDISRGSLCMSHHIDIQNEHCERVARVTFKDALKIAGL